MPRLLAATALASLLAQSAAAEEVITIPREGGEMFGTLATPEGDPAPVVLLLHGFTGSRDELPIAGTEDGVFSRTARILTEAGYASLRIDFLGSGQSTGYWADTTFSGQIDDALAAIDWLQESDRVDAERLALLGWSQGGLVASYAAMQSDAVDALVLWAPLTNPLENFSNIFGADEMARALAAEADEEVALTLPWGLPTTLRGTFFDEMETTSTGEALEHYDGPLLILMGARDDLITPQPVAGELLVEQHGGEGVLHVLDMDHAFNLFTGPETLDGEMMPLVLDWLAENL